MARQVLLSFAGAAEIPFTPYQATQAREAEVPAVPGIPTISGTPAIPAIPGHPGYPEGYGAKWDLVASETNASVASQIIAAALRNHFVTRLGSNYRSGNLMDSGDIKNISGLVISYYDSDNVNRKAQLLALEGTTQDIIFLSPQAPITLNAQFIAPIDHPDLEAVEFTLTNRLFFTIAGQSRNPIDRSSIVAELYANNGGINQQPPAIAITGTGGGESTTQVTGSHTALTTTWLPSQGGSPNTGRWYPRGPDGAIPSSSTIEHLAQFMRRLEVNIFDANEINQETRLQSVAADDNISVTIGGVTLINNVGTVIAVDQFHQAWTFETGWAAGAGEIDIPIRRQLNNLFKDYLNGTFINMTIFNWGVYGPSNGETHADSPSSDILVGSSLFFTSATELETGIVHVEVVGTGIHYVFIATAAFFDFGDSHNYMEYTVLRVISTNSNGTDWQDTGTVNLSVEKALYINLPAYDDTIEVPGIPSPEIPPIGGIPGTPAGPDTPAVPGIPSIPAVPAIYEGAMYGRPAIPPFGIWAERLAMTMSHRVENELEIIDIQISGHDYIIRQDWVAPKDHRVRPFCWMQDERGIVQTVETVDQSDEMTTRFSTMAIVNGPANATAVPPPADFEEGDDISEPSFRVQPEVVNHVFVVHDPAEARINQPISPVRVGWSQTRNHDAEILTRVNNHPLDGALLTTTDMVFNTPPFPPGISGDLTLYLHIWVEGSTDLMAILINEANEIAKFTRIGTLRVNTIQGILFVSIARFPPETSDSSFEVSTNDPTDVIVTPPGGDVPTEAQVRAIVDQRLEDQLLELTIRPATVDGFAGEPPSLYYSRTGLFICPIKLELPKVSFTIPEGRRIVDIFDSGATVTEFFTVDPNNARRWISNFEYGPGGIELVINTEAI